MLNVENLKKRVQLLIRALWIEENDYCLCWSWKKLWECCLLDFSSDTQRFMDEKMSNELEKNLKILLVHKDWDKEAQKEFAKEINDWIACSLQNKWMFEECINPHCKCESIQSHLFPDWFIKEIDKEYEFSMEWVEKGIWPNSFKTKLWCGKSDTKLFQKTDAVWDMKKLFSIAPDDEPMETHIKNSDIIWEFLIKTYFFKLKTEVLNLMIHFYRLLYFWDYTSSDFMKKWVKEHKKLYIMVPLSGQPYKKH